jgi:HK97 family phage major capsid protein
MREIGDDSGVPAVGTHLNQREKPRSSAELRALPEYADQFFDALLAGASPKSVAECRHSAAKYGLLMNAITTTGGDPAGEEGGFNLPIEFDNQIKERMRQFVNLADYVNEEVVDAYSGWRSVESAAAALPFSELTEMDTLADNEETESPVFSKVEYAIKDYGGFLRVSNGTLKDTRASLMNYLSRWMGKKAVLTYNSLILAKINALTPTAITDVKNLFPGIKTALNKTLDPAVSARAIIITNQSGFDLMDQLVDGTGRALMQPNPVDDTQMVFKGRKVVMLSDAHYANLAAPSRARIAIGDGEEFITHFKREGFQMDITNIGGSAWRSYSSEVRGILRSDVEVVDSGAMALLTVTI